MENGVPTIASPPQTFVFIYLSHLRLRLGYRYPQIMSGSEWGWNWIADRGDEEYSLTSAEGQ